MSPLIHKQIERLAYAWLLLSLATGWCVVKVLIVFAPLLRNRKPEKDFLFFPYAHKDNTGTRARFQDYFPLLDRDGFTYDIHYPSTMEEYNALYHVQQPSRAKEYWYYHKLFWKRLGGILTAPNYKAVFFQRALFPEYYNQRHAIHEQLLRALHANITVDYFDADYARDEALYNNIIKYCDKVTVVNQFLFDRYSKHHTRVYLLDLSIDTKRYPVKTDFALHQPVRFFWTGLIENAQMNLPLVLPLLEKLNETMPLKLVMVSNSREGLPQSIIEHHRWNAETFFDLMLGCDVALYPVGIDDVFSRGKVAYKALEYAAAGLPMIASPQGLSSRFENGKDVLIANSVDEWKQNILQLLNDEAVRKHLSASARKTVVEYHDVNATYNNFLNVLQA